MDNPNMSGFHSNQSSSAEKKIEEQHIEQEQEKKGEKKEIRKIEYSPPLPKEKINLRLLSQLSPYGNWNKPWPTSNPSHPSTLTHPSISQISDVAPDENYFILFLKTGCTTSPKLWPSDEKSHIINCQPLTWFSSSTSEMSLWARLDAIYIYVYIINWIYIYI